jgi:predicted DNA-binding transcriptional regulator AlpA
MPGSRPLLGADSLRNDAQPEKNAGQRCRSHRQKRNKLMSKAEKGWSGKPLLSVEDAAILLGQSRSSIYRAIERGDLPLPVFTINGRLRIARRSVERLLAGELPLERVLGTGEKRDRIPGVP